MGTDAPLISGMTIIRNGLRFDYPFVEAIRAILPICDEFVIVVGDSDDGTREAVEAIGDPKIRIVDTTWSPHVTPRKCLLAEQTSLGLHHCRGRWCVYVQGNEIIHQDSLPILRELMERHAEDPQIEAILLERLTFWADFDHVFAAYPKCFKYTVRIIKPHIGAYSIRDAMSFAVFDGYSRQGRYPRAIDSGQYLYRYANVHTPTAMEAKGARVHKGGSKPIATDHFYTKFPRQYLRRYTGDHPTVMAERRAAHPSQYDLDDPRCRTALSAMERWHLLETAWYRRFGMLRHRNHRFQLIGGFLPKADRPR